jgi:hypothetical protein
MSYINEIFNYTKDLIKTRLHHIPDEEWSTKTTFWIEWGQYYIFLQYLSGRININYGGSDKIRYNVIVDNMNEAYKMITIIINQISPYKLH